MAYVSLYRKYRPQSFAEVVGQSHVTQTLVNAITEDRLHHAYLFTGPRGTGKTSTARILAKAINCAEGPTAEPCQRCEACVSITDGSSVDVIELDMASHGGVDDARELRERALFAPANARKKVYILDEVHMASQAAFNALLKLIEEPPGHVMFAMATTDPQKVIPTIMSRVQRLDLRRVDSDAVGGHVERIASLEGVTLTPEAVEAVVRAGDGSVRDTLSILEQVMSFAGDEVDVDDVGQVLGVTPAERTFEATALIAAGDLAGALALVQDLLDDGHDLRRFGLDLVSHLRDLLVLKVASDRPDLVEGTADWRGRLAAQAELLGQDTLLRAVDILADTVVEMRRGPARLPLELALAKIAAPAVAGDTAALADRIARLETAGGTGATVAAPRQPTGDEQPEAEEDMETEEEPEAEAEPEAGQGDPDTGHEAADEQPPPGDVPAGTAAPEDQPTAPTEAPAPADQRPADAETVGDATPDEVSLDDVLESWSRILDSVRSDSIRLHAIVQAGTPTRLRGSTLTLTFAQHFHAEETAKTSHAGVISNALKNVLGTRLKIRTEVADSGPGTSMSSDGDGDRAGTAATDDAEEVEVREAEVTDEPDVAEAADRAERLLRDELGAEPVDGD